MTMNEEDKQIQAIFDRRPPRVKTVVLTYKGKTMFVPEADIIDWEKKQKQDAISAAITVGATSVILVMAALLMTHVGSPRACLFTIGTTLAVCIGARAYRILKVKRERKLL